MPPLVRGTLDEDIVISDRLIGLHSLFSGHTEDIRDSEGEGLLEDGYEQDGPTGFLTCNL